jgi:hypothetical protein
MKNVMNKLKNFFFKKKLEKKSHNEVVKLLIEQANVKKIKTNLAYF